MRPILSLAYRANRRGVAPIGLMAGREVYLCNIIPSSRRTLFGFSFGGDKKASQKSGGVSGSGQPVLLEQDNLFHPLSKSPIPSMRARGERIKTMAPCPVSLNRDGVRKLVQFECPDCGWPTHYSEKEWSEDTEHAKYVPRLREANEDEHDLRSGREMTEFKLPGHQGFEEVINFSSWDIFFYTRNHDSIETERSRRHVSKLLSFPCTVAGVLHENSPYTKRNGRLTHEGLRSMVALRQTLHPVLGSRPSLDVTRIFVVGARAESTLPPLVWDQLRHMFPGTPLHIFFIGPEVTLPRESGRTVGYTQASSPNSQENNNSVASMHRGKQKNSNYGAPSKTVVISEGLTLTSIQCNYEDVHAQLEPFDPYTDIFFCFSPGFGFPSMIGQEEVNRARWEARDEKERMAAARDTYFARGAPSEGAEQQRLNPVGGDIPAAEPPPELPVESDQPTSAEMPHGRYTSLTTAPIVQAQREWARALGQMLSTKCALISTGFSPADVERDILAFESVEGIQGEFEWLINPGENVFASQQWAVADFDPRVAVKANWGIWAVRGKRYDIEGPSLWSGGWRGSEEES
ncbi:hypothetical protein L7F22_019376 [Adiantum nelumboides]|nr:hypothetical protein [Adiantum nelumboides]